MSSPLALYVEQVSGHEQESPGPQPRVTVYPPSPPDDPIFDSFNSAPMLDDTRTNRILVYYGCFNPPHRGHLHLLKHVFLRGVHDLNVIAAIICPRSDEGVSRKVREEDGKFMFGKEERCLLWKRDLCFPPWGWVYEDSSTELKRFQERLIQATKNDGISLEFVYLYGPGMAFSIRPRLAASNHGTIVLSDAARKAGFQHPWGRLKDLSDCTKWERIRVDKQELWYYAKVKARRALVAMKTFRLQKVQKMLDDGRAYVHDAVETTVSKAMEDMKGVLICKKQVKGREITLRFVKCENVDPRAEYNDISSSDLRKIMNEEQGAKLKEALDWMALSADILWRYRASWIDKARQGTGLRIKFQEPNEEPPSFENPPCLGLSKMVELPLSIQRPSSLPATLHEKSPFFEEPQRLGPPQSFEQPQPLEGHRLIRKSPPINDKKRRFSATGLGDDVEVMDDPIVGEVLAEDEEV